MECHFIPPYLLGQVAAAQDEDLARLGHHTQRIDASLREARSARSGRQAPAKRSPGVAWEVCTADNHADLPGAEVRSAGEADSEDVTVNEAALGVSETLALLTDLGRSSYDDQGATVVATVHYEKDYDNAFWDGEQLVCGDGDGKVFGSFTKPIDVLGHELFHAVTQYTANFTYHGQSGALNESISDCFGSCVKQRHLGQDADAADWLIGAGIFVPGIEGVALRSMKDPGTAYDDATLGKDPQVATMADYVQTEDDDGGVHTNSGIPNRAFYLAATGIGGPTWEGAGRIWYAALTSGVPAGATFARFAAACVEAAGPHADVVRQAWDQVGVTASASKTADASGPASPAATTVAVTRSGGFTGLVSRGVVDLDSDDPRVPEVAALLDRIDLSRTAAAVQGSPGADRYVYDFAVGEQQLRVHETALTGDLQRLAQIALE